MTGNRQTLLHILKTLGPKSTTTLADRLDMTLAGVRKHLKQLAQDGLVCANDVASGVGRPDQVWQLTRNGHQQFPDTHDTLTLDLIGSIRSVFGEDGLDQLIAAREGETIERYSQAVSAATSPRQKIEALAALRSDEGYMAEVAQVDATTWRLAENHCPVCAAARVCQGLCRSELAVFRTVLGKGFVVERDEFLMQGARRCSYLIRLTDPVSAGGSGR